jgi:hypothetical protein
VACGTAATWDFYKQAYGRNGIRNDRGRRLQPHPHGSNHVSAFWQGLVGRYAAGVPAHRFRVRAFGFPSSLFPMAPPKTPDVRDALALARPGNFAVTSPLSAIDPMTG